MGDFFQLNGLMSENKFWNGVKGVQTREHSHRLPFTPKELG